MIQFKHKDTETQLHNGDCVDIMREEIEDGSVDVIFADPPYFLSDGSNRTVLGGKIVKLDKGEWDRDKGHKENYAFHERWIEECHRVLKDTGTIWVAGTYHSIFYCGTVLKSFGFHIINDVIWFKPNASPNMTCTRITASHETLIWAKKDKDKKHYFGYKELKNGVYKDDFIKKKGKQMRSVWVMNSVAQREKVFGGHPTQKPLALLSRVLTASAQEGDTILDPFCGSGTTGVIAQQKKAKRFIGIDLDIEYLKTTERRMLNDSPLF